MSERGKRTEEERERRCVCNGKEHGREGRMGKRLRVCNGIRCSVCVTVQCVCTVVFPLDVMARDVSRSLKTATDRTRLTKVKT